MRTHLHSFASMNLANVRLSAGDPEYQPPDPPPPTYPDPTEPGPHAPPDPELPPLDPSPDPDPSPTRARSDTLVSPGIWGMPLRG
jgi:hypothetical protein